MYILTIHGKENEGAYSVEDEVMIKTCQMHDYRYAVITQDDIVIPPTTKNDFI